MKIVCVERWYGIYVCAKDHSLAVFYLNRVEVHEKKVTLLHQL